MTFANQFEVIVAQGFVWTKIRGQLRELSAGVATPASAVR
jgi:hypothetical protein